MFFKRARKDISPEDDESVKRLRVVVVSFEDGCAQNCGRVLSDSLAENPLFEVVYHHDTGPKPFLNFKQADFFDLLENGQKILKKENAEILVWGYRIDQRLQLNFQKINHYETAELPFFSILNSLYLPFSYFQNHQLPESALLLISGTILAAAHAPEEQNELNRIIEQISRTSSPQGLTTEDMPYVINLLLVMYLQAKAESLTAQDIALIRTLLGKCFAMTKQHKDAIFNGCFYANAGQFFSILSVSEEMHKFEHHHKAVECFRYARKFFNRYNYPYDFAFQSYQLSRQYFEFWKWTNDIQAIRDAVLNLRDAEKIFTGIRFPAFWAEIQKDLGYYLSILGSQTQNDEILMSAVEHYKNRQKILTREDHPLIWAEDEESIASLLYTIGKMHQNEEYLLESIECYAAAADIYEELKRPGALRQMRVCQSKAEEVILQLHTP